MNVASRVSTFDALDLGYPKLRHVHTYDQKILDQFGLEAVVVPKKRSKPCHRVVSAVKHVFKQINGLYYKTVPYCIRERIKWIRPLCKRIYKLISHIYRMSLLLVDTAQSTTAAVSIKSQSLKFFRKVKFLSLLSVFDITYNLATNIQEFAKSILSKKISAGVDDGLLILNNISDLASIADTTIIALKEFGVLAASEALSVASTTLLGISSALSTAMVAYHSKQWYHTSRFSSKLKQKFAHGCETNDFKDIMAFINRKENLKLQILFGVKDGGELKVRLNSLFLKDQDKKTPETKDKIEQAMAAMKKRLITKEITCALKILVCTISIVASIVLMFTPLTALGFGLFAISSGIGIAILVSDYFATMQFRKAINHLAPDTISFDKKDENQVINKIKTYNKESRGFIEELKSVTTRIYNEKNNSYLEELKYVAPIKSYIWKHRLRKQYRYRMSNVIRWKPGRYFDLKKSDTVGNSHTTAIPLSFSNPPKLSKSEIHAIPK